MSILLQNVAQGDVTGSESVACRVRINVMMSVILQVEAPLLCLIRPLSK